jgi:hypothetical protein
MLDKDASLYYNTLTYLLGPFLTHDSVAGISMRRFSAQFGYYKPEADARTASRRAIRRPIPSAIARSIAASPAAVWPYILVLPLLLGLLLALILLGA